MPHARPLTLAALALAATTARAEERWIEVRSPHFQVVANTGAGEARRVAQRLEKFRAAVDQLVPGGPSGDAPITTVLLFRSASALAPLFPTWDGKRRPIGGLFASGQDRSYIAVAVKANETFETVFHEYTHLLLARLPAPAPLWLGEGLAELYSNAEVREREVLVGRALPDHARLLKERGLFSLDTLLDAGQDSPQYNEPGRQDHFYAQSWALAHYVFIGSRRGRALLDALAAGRTGEDALAAALELDAARLQRELATYVGRLSYPFAREPVQPVADEALREAPVAAHEALFFRGDCLAHLGRIDDARPFLEKALALSPTSAGPHRSFGLAHYHAKDFAAAARWLAGAIERDPRDGYARYLHASAVVRQAGNAFGPAAAATLREDLLVATEQLPRLSEAWQLRAYVDSVLGRTDDEAVHALRRALELSPGRTDLQQRLDLVLARRGAPKAP
jgi:tetratricopeptide (TPR) repeat protein